MSRVPRNESAHRGGLSIVALYGFASFGIDENEHHRRRGKLPIHNHARIRVSVLYALASYRARENQAFCHGLPIAQLAQAGRVRLNT